MSPTPSQPSGAPEAPPSAADSRSRDQLRPLDFDRLPDHRDRLFRAAYALCGSREDAEDLVQETFLRILRRPRFLRREDDLGYLLKVLRNTWINAYKTRSRRPATVEYDETVNYVVDPGADPGVVVTELHTLYAAVYELSPPLRDALVAVDIVGLSYRQAASALGVRQGTIMSRLFRARNKVAELLERGDADPASRPETHGRARME